MEHASPLPDKRDIVRDFRERLQRLHARSGLNRSQFAQTVGVDRSALTHMLDGDSSRLPRAETLMRMASAHGVSLDWLLGLSADDAVSTAIKPALALEEVQNGGGETLLNSWHREAAGTKIRYVPTTVPDLLRTHAVIAHETRQYKRDLESQVGEMIARIDYNRRPETDMEVCMPVQTLEALADGSGIWRDLPRDVRAEQLAHMARLIDDLYPTFRLYLFDGQAQFSVPYTVFGPMRAAVYAGDMYLVLNAREAVATMTRHFDNLIRAATVQAHEVADHLRQLAVS